MSLKRGPSSPESVSTRTGYPPTYTPNLLPKGSTFNPNPPLDLSNLFGPTQPSTTFSTPSTQPSQAKETLLQARDLIVKAYSLSKDREEQARVLDLLELFREYIEKGTLRKTSSIISSQITHLENATRQIESKARTLSTRATSTPIPTPLSTTLPPTQASSSRASFASIASLGANISQNQE